MKTNLKITTITDNHKNKKVLKKAQRNKLIVIKKNRIKKQPLTK